jgi:hypothetical protein
MSHLAENAAAIAMHFGMSPLREEAYHKAGESMGGFPGFYRAAIEAGEVLDLVAKQEELSWGDDADWIQTVEAYADRILQAMAKNKHVPSKDELLVLAKESLYYFMEPKFPAPLAPPMIQTIRDLLVTALEGGSNYWYTIDHKKNVYPAGTSFKDYKEGGKMQPPGNYYHWSELLPTIPGGAIMITDKTEESEQKSYRLDLPTLQKGLSVMKHKYPKRYKRVMEEDYDADDGDTFLQSAVFGEVIYG